jgi:hypothetical protein
MALRRAAALAAATMLTAIALVPGTPAQYAGAELDLNMESSATVTASYSSQSVRLDGNITVDKPPKVRVTVYLVTANDAGWVTECSPSEFFFMDTYTAAFTCAVHIPAKTTDTVAAVTVHAFLNGYGPTSDYYANATITVAGSLPVNGTMSAAPGTWGLNSPLEKALGLTLPGIALVATLIIVPAVAVAWFLRRRRRRAAAPPPQQAKEPII